MMQEARNQKTRFTAKISAALLLFCGLQGCGSLSDSHAHETKTPPSANVGKLDAWSDAEMIANRGQGRSAAAGSGESMLPVYGTHTMLVITAVAYDSLQPGMNVAYLNRNGREVVHRLGFKLAGGWTVAGLNNADEDADLVTPQNLVGVVYATFNYDDDD
jgi:hypothetical protein